MGTACATRTYGHHPEVVTIVRRTLPAEVGDALRQARLARGWSVRRAERELELGHPYLLRLERGERCPSSEVAMRLALVLKLDDGLTERLMGLAVDVSARAEIRQRLHT